MCINKCVGFFSLVLPLWCLYFFRIPTRLTPLCSGAVVSPADGKVVSIKEVVPPEEFGLGNKPRVRISIFLSIFDVHIYYIPVGGEIKSIYYEPGRFFAAHKDKASEHNEKNAVVIGIDGNDNDIGVVQIAGLIARRIRCDVNQGDNVATGELYGLIRFGSRADVYLPEGEVPTIKIGDRVKAAETIISVLSQKIGDF